MNTQWHACFYDSGFEYTTAYCIFSWWWIWIRKNTSASTILSMNAHTAQMFPWFWVWIHKSTYISMTNVSMILGINTQQHIKIPWCWVWIHDVTLWFHDSGYGHTTARTCQWFSAWSVWGPCWRSWWLTEREWWTKTLTPWSSLNPPAEVFHFHQTSADFSSSSTPAHTCILQRDRETVTEENTEPKFYTKTQSGGGVGRWGTGSWGFGCV